MTTDFGRKPTDEEREAKKELDAAVEAANAKLAAIRPINKSWGEVCRVENKGRPPGKVALGWVGILKEGALPPPGYEATDGTVVTTPGPCLGLTKPPFDGGAIKVVKDW